jgi:hypothetical protein
MKVYDEQGEGYNILGFRESNANDQVVKDVGNWLAS